MQYMHFLYIPATVHRTALYYAQTLRRRSIYFKWLIKLLKQYNWPGSDDACSLEIRSRFREQSLDFLIDNLRFIRALMHFADKVKAHNALSIDEVVAWPVRPCLSVR